MDVTKYIISYLTENPSVIVPGLGKFIAIDKPSQIQGNTVIPPVRMLEFNSSEDENDGALDAYIAAQENISPQEATTHIAAFYNQIKEKLAHKQSIMLNRLGTLSLDQFGNIHFEPEEDTHIPRKDSYGLDEVLLHLTTPVQEHAPDFTQSSSTPTPETANKPVAEDGLFASENMRVRENTERRTPPPSERQTPPERQAPPVRPVRQADKTVTAKKKAPSNKGNGFPMWILLVLLIAGALGAGSYFYYPKLAPYIDPIFSSVFKDRVSRPQTNITEEVEEVEIPDSEVAQNIAHTTDKKNALNPASGEPQAEVQTKQPETQPETSQQVAKPTEQIKPTQPVTQPTSGIGQGKYLVIVASFDVQSKVDAFSKKLQAEGITHEAFDYGNGRIRIAVASSDDKPEAQRMADQFKSKPHCEGAWITPRKK